MYSESFPAVWQGQTYLAGSNYSRISTLNIAAIPRRENFPPLEELLLRPLPRTIRSLPTFVYRFAALITILIATKANFSQSGSPDKDNNDGSSIFAQRVHKTGKLLAQFDKESFIPYYEVLISSHGQC